MQLFLPRPVSLRFWWMTNRLNQSCTRTGRAKNVTLRVRTLRALAGSSHLRIRFWAMKHHLLLLEHAIQALVTNGAEAVERQLQHAQADETRRYTRLRRHFPPHIAYLGVALLYEHGVDVNLVHL